jgi:hypothetical protein
VDVLDNPALCLKSLSRGHGLKKVEKKLKAPEGCNGNEQDSWNATHFDDVANMSIRGKSKDGETKFSYP